ncbi:hypothetical protein J8TS2_24250 [Lederbergia ruris]|uniref:Uncharacterized protein n=1 Tax=Lederbergia ruris TaxID=217495 RepID=A0ABQ4KKY0_9BACI|nr:hypothetical protein J8TS2_24250 [Lederbergia ruris]
MYYEEERRKARENFGNRNDLFPELEKGSPQQVHVELAKKAGIGKSPDITPDLGQGFGGKSDKANSLANLRQNSESPNLEGRESDGRTAEGEGTTGRER